MSRSLNVTICRGTRSYRASATTSGTRIRNDTATTAGSSAAHPAHEWSVNVSGSTTRAVGRHEHDRLGHRGHAYGQPIVTLGDTRRFRVEVTVAIRMARRADHRESRHVLTQSEKPIWSLWRGSGQRSPSPQDCDVACRYLL